MQSNSVDSPINLFIIKLVEKIDFSATFPTSLLELELPE